MIIWERHNQPTVSLKPATETSVITIIDTVLVIE